MTAPQARVLVWDWTVRLFHWLAVLIVGLMWWTAEQDMMDWHRRMGLAMLGLLVYRIVWGLVGPSTARFSAMLFHPRALVAYARQLLSGPHRPGFGHNPLGTFSVIAMLLSLATQVTTGLFAVDVDGLESGPLATFVSFETGRLFAEIHEISFIILRVLIVLHVMAIAAYLVFFRDNLVSPMVTGRRARSDFAANDLTDSRAHVLRIIVAAAIAITFVSAILITGG